MLVARGQGKYPYLPTIVKEDWIKPPLQYKGFKQLCLNRDINHFPKIREETQKSTLHSGFKRVSSMCIM